LHNSKSIYTPIPAKIIEIINEAPKVRTFKIRPAINHKFDFNPGQFIELSLYGYGEAPFAISSPKKILPEIEVTVKSVGRVTRALFKINRNSIVGMRGPYGNGFPIDKMKNKSILMVSGGTGLSPLRPLIWEIYDNRDNYEDVVLLYGAKTPNELLFRREYKEWERRINMHITVDYPDETWSGNVGVVTRLLDEVEIPRGSQTIVIICGPPIMMKYTILKLFELKFMKDQIFVSLERLMQCGVGKCGHCMLSNGKYVCIDGPIFRLDEIPLREVEL